MQAISSEEFSQRLHALLRQDRLALLIQLAEKWSQSQALPTNAALIEGEALLHLCRMDKAWTRFREVLEHDPENESAMILVIELFLRRGWPTRARKMIPRLRALNPKSPRIARLESRSAAPPIGPPRNANQVIQTASPSQLVAIAERFLCSGSQLKGQQILEFALRKDPQNMRARRLIWACQGDFTSVQNWDDLWEDALAEDVEDESIIEPTVNMVMESSEVRVDAFPSLFRIEEEENPEPDDEGESTRRMAFPEDFPVDSETEETRGFDGDTQVLDVVSQEMTNNDPFESSGPSVQKIDVSVDNDDDVIVFTQIDESQLRPPPSPIPSGPIKVVDKRPIPEGAKASNNQIDVSAEDGVPLPDESFEQGADDSKTEIDIKIDEDKGILGSSNLRYLFAFVIFATLITLASFGLNQSAKNRIDTQVTEAVLSADYGSLNRIALQLEAQAKSGNPPVDTREAYLGLVHAFLWRDYTHADSDLQVAQRVMRLDSTRSTVPWIPNAIDAIIASGESDWESVDEILQDHESGLIDYLRTEAAIKISRESSSITDQNPRTAILFLGAVETIDDLVEWTKEHSTVEYRLLYLERFWYRLSDDEKQAELSAIEQYMEKNVADTDVDVSEPVLIQEKLSSIQYFRYEFFRSLQGNPKGYQKRLSVYRLDLNNPLFQMWVATDYLRQDKHGEAFPLFEKCARVYYDCLIGAVGVEITRDRLTDADNLVERYSVFYSSEEQDALRRWIDWAGGVEIKPQASDPPWLFHWVGGTQVEDPNLIGLDTPVQNYVYDVLTEASHDEINPDAMMDSYLLWSDHHLKQGKSESESVLDGLRELSKREVYSARQWGIIIRLYDNLNYSQSDKRDARQFYLQLKPNGDNAERIKP